MAEYIESQLTANLQELETMLGVVSTSIQGMILRGADYEEIKAYIIDMTVLGHESEITGFLSVFAYFDVPSWTDREGFSGISPETDWALLEKQGLIILEERDWYQLAFAANGAIVTTEPYADIVTGETALSFARGIYDDDGNFLGIIGLNVLLDRIHALSYENHSQSQYVNYWMLFDNNLNIIAHFDQELLGIQLRDTQSGLANFADEFEQGQTILGRRYINHLGEARRISIKQLDNGWYLGVATLEDNYLNNINSILWFLILAGLLMSTGLSYILIRIHKSKSMAETTAQIVSDAHKTLQTIFDMLPVCARIMDLETLTYLYFNKATLDLFEYDTVEEMQGISALDLMPEIQPDGTPTMRYAEHVVGCDTSVIQVYCKKKSGELFLTRITSCKLNYKGKAASLAVIEDITAEKDAIHKLDGILNGLATMIYVTNPKTNEILFMNDAMKEHYRIEGDCVGQICYKLVQVDQETRCEFCPCFRLDRYPDKVIEWEEHSTLTNRIYRNVDSYIPWPDGQMVHMQHSVDMTELIAAREFAKKSDRYKSAFLANMSHEIRTPMNAILGIAEIRLRDENLAPDVEEAFRKIYESGDLLLNIINDILDLSKIEAGKLELHPVKYDIPSLAYDTVQLNRLRYESRPIEFTLNVDENIPLELFGDELRIKQVLNNILSNAFKYTEKGAVELAVTFIPNTPDSGDLVFTVTDTGQGISEEQIEKLFDEYSRFNNNANRTTVGAGLGMSITKRLLDLMDGTISVKSEVGKGSTFVVCIPQKRVGPEVCGAELVEKLRKFRFQSLSIVKKTQFLREYMPYGSVLIVDDVESNIYVTKGLLMPYGLKIETASSGFEAIDRIKSGKVYDVVFMDHMMPKMDGIEATRIIRDMGYDHIIVALTANALIGREEMFLKNGFDGFIPKPIDSREMNLILNEFIRNKQPEDVINAARKEQRAREQKNKGVVTQDMTAMSELVDFFILDANNALNALDPLSTKLQNLDDEEMDSYITTVHGMKSALANIGEKGLSGAAFRLEKAARERDVLVLSNETSAFMNSLKSLIIRLKPIEKDSNAEITGEDSAYLYERLFKIQKACTALNKNAAKAALNELKQREWPGDINTVLDDIAVNILHSSFKKAAATAKKTAEEISKQ